MTVSSGEKKKMLTTTLKTNQTIYVIVILIHDHLHVVL